MEITNIQKLCALIRYYILQATTTAGSGHPSSSLSSVELATTLFFRHLSADLEDPHNPNNDRFILSKGHASPLLYALYTVAGKLSPDELITLRTFKSPIEGHPSMRFPYTEIPTGSLGQGLSVAVGMGLALKKLALGRNEKQEIASVCNVPYIYVLLGDGEMAEGQVWEAIQLASYYQLANIIAIVDVNGYGQNQETMYGHTTQPLAKRIASFDFRVYEVPDGHNIDAVDAAFTKARIEAKTSTQPAVIIAKTIKGKGVSFMEGKVGWHGKTISKEELPQVLVNLGVADLHLKGEIAKPVNYQLSIESHEKDNQWIGDFPQQIPDTSEKVATRVAYGQALAALAKQKSHVIALDAELRISTGAETVRSIVPEQFIEMFIAEQNMVSAAFGLAKYAFVPYISTFGSFFTRAFDQLRMGAYAGLHIVVGASHNGVTVGPDGPSQMGLEDIALFRSLYGSTVLAPADAVSTKALIQEAYKGNGIVYIRTTRNAMPVVYSQDEHFPIGGSKVFPAPNIGKSQKHITVVTVGETLSEARTAQALLAQKNIAVCVVDCYSIKPIDAHTLKNLVLESYGLIVVEDHVKEGGLGDAVMSALGGNISLPYEHLAVRTMPISGSRDELMRYEGITAENIVKTAESFHINL